MMRRFIALCTLVAAASVVTYAGDAVAAPLKCVSNDVNAGPAVLSDVVTTDAPIQKGHLRVAGAPAAASTCAAPNAAPAVVEPTATFNYKAHMFKNRSNAAACVEVRYVFTASTQGTGLHETAAYLGGFDSTNPAANYLGDGGRNEGGPDVNVFSFTVPAMNDFTLVTTWAGPATPGYEPKYDLYVAHCGQMVLTSIAPNAGPVVGGQNVTIAGSGFEGAAPTLSIGVAATNVVVVDDSTLVATTAANAAGIYDVTATSGAVSATLPQAYTYGGVATDAGTDAGVLLDGGAEGGLDGGRDASTGGPTQGGPTQGSSSSGGTTDTDSGLAADGGDDDDDGDATTGDGGAKKASGTIKKKAGGDEELVCACNEVGKGTTPGMGAFATMALGILAVLRIRKRR
jgi:hypothetical protein